MTSRMSESSLAVTTTYLRRLEGQRDGAWAGVAELLGVAEMKGQDGTDSGDGRTGDQQP